MPCIKCSNGKYKYGAAGDCVFDTLAACKRAAAAIHIQDEVPTKSSYNSSECLSLEDMYKVANREN